MVDEGGDVPAGMIVVSHLLFWTNVLVQLLAWFLFFDMMMCCFEISYKYQTNSLGLLISPVNKVPGR